jgi:EpsD family peptidyl-prolyl cis-trans isomerase
MAFCSELSMETSHAVRARSLIVLGLICVGLIGCSKGEQASSAGGQVIAHVGSDVVTTQELDNEMRLENVPNERRKDPDLVRRVLGEIVTRKYLAQQAIAAKLDREPNVLLDILRSREQVLASEEVSRNVSAKVSATTKADVDKYIANNPSKFAERKVFSVDQVVIPLVSNLQAVLDATKPLNSLDEVESKLSEMGVPHNRSLGTLNTAELPDELAQSLKAKTAEMIDTDIYFVRSGQNGAFLKIRDQRANPIEGAQAEALARQLMRIDAIRSEAGMASFSANMEANYQGDYAGIMKPGGTPTKK